MARKAYASTPRRLGIIYNTQSGRHRRRWGHHALPADIPAFEANTPNEIATAVTALAEQEIDLLAVAGGDGTVQCVLGEILLQQRFTQPPSLALVPTGSTNMTANDAGFVNIRRHGWQPLREWAAGERRATLRERDVLRIQASDSQPPIAGMFFGAGAVYHAVSHTQDRLHSVGLRGEVGPALAFLRFIRSVITGDRRQFRPTRLCLRDESGRQIDGEALLIIVSTLQKLVLRFRPFWGRETGPVRWTIVQHGARRLLGRLSLIARGSSRAAERAPEDYVSHNSTSLYLYFDGGFIVDGEFFQSRPADGPVRLSSAGQLQFVAL